MLRPGLWPVGLAIIAAVIAWSLLQVCFSCVEIDCAVGDLTFVMHATGQQLTLELG